MVTMKFRPKEEDFGPRTPGATSRLARFVTGEDNAFRIGFLRMERTNVEPPARAMWMDEVFYVTEGKMKVTCTSPPDFKEEVHELSPGDAFFFGKGTVRKMQALETCTCFYVAIPASSKGMGYVFKQPTSER